MREIKFRGRISAGIENAGTWVYWGVNGCNLIDAIDPDTIGEYTGLKDLINKEICIGDTLELCLLHGDLIGEVKICEKRQIPVVKFFDKPEPLHCFAGISDDDTSVQIIGNIYENKELLND